MATDIEDERYDPSDSDAAEILEFLRARVREYGFAEADLALEARLAELGISSSLRALKEYFLGLDRYLRIFKSDANKSTDRALAQFLDGEFSWSLRRGGDPERRIEAANPTTVVVEDLRSYTQVEELLSSLRSTMRQLGISGSNDGDNEPEPFQKARTR